ncbi:hypothetical protein RBU61_03660 [Tissierella sp. MB52-C2]|uniref:hypothetical protein n=1 Tax=Tissierella sp. MB52-C2 TaxID=3070999 RepID=UPI00280AAD97|nr:hypothetical protein [Tissierella sp. MB52-C2]WMM25777.1 hypothetical protein RBU61_03660 [Tissierella sp. MB52-C2]
MEWRVLTDSNIKLIIKNKLTWIYIIYLGLFVLGSKQSVAFYHGSPEMVAINYNMYMVESFFMLPVLLGIMCNDRINKFLTTVILSKLNHKNNHFISQFLSYFSIAIGTFIFANAKMLFFTLLYGGKFQWIFFIKYFFLYSLTLVFYIPFMMFIWSLSKKFVLMIFGTFIFLGLNLFITNIYIPILFISDIFQNILMKKDILFWISRVIYACLGILLLMNMEKIYSKRSRD